MTDEDLLKPSLANGGRRQVSIHSVGAMIAAAFFGGAAAVPLLAVHNSHRQGRLARDLPLLAAALAAAIAIGISAAAWFLPGEDPREVRFNVRLVNRVAGFALVALYYLAMRRVYRTQRTMGLDPPSPWIPVILSVLAGAVTTGVTFVLVRQDVIGDFL